MKLIPVCALALACIPTPRGRCAVDGDCGGGGLFCADGVCQGPPLGALETVPETPIGRSAVAEVRVRVLRAHGVPSATLRIRDASIAGEVARDGVLRFAVPGDVGQRGWEGRVPFTVELHDDLGHATSVDGSILIDDRPPRVAFEPPGLVLRGAPIAFEVSVEDAFLVSVESERIELVPRGNGAYAVHVDTRTLPPDVTELPVDVRAFDLAGNETRVSATVRITRLKWKGQVAGTLESLVLGEEQVIAVSSEGTFWTLKRATGEQVSSTKAGPPAGAPAVDGTFVWLSQSDKSENQLCRYGPGVATSCCPLPAPPAGGPSLLDGVALVATRRTATEPGRLVAAAATPSRCVPTPGPIADFAGSVPAIAADGTIYASGDDAVVAVRFEREAFRNPIFAPSKASRGDEPALLAPEHGFQRVVYARATSELEIFSFTISAGGPPSSRTVSLADETIQLTSPTIAADGTITAGGDPGSLLGLRPDGQTWKAVLDSAPTGPPTHGAGEMVYVGTGAGWIEARSARDGSRIWTWEAGSRIAGSLAIGCDGVLYAATVSGAVLALVVDAPGLADSPWPRAGHDVRGSGDARRPLRSAAGACLE